jgi:hypothetical protein
MSSTGPKRVRFGVGAALDRAHDRRRHEDRLVAVSAAQLHQNRCRAAAEVASNVVGLVPSTPTMPGVLVGEQRRALVGFGREVGRDRFSTPS